jgi:hypothetical protein
MHPIAASTLAVATPRHHTIHASGISVLAIFTLIAGVVAIAAFALQVNDKLKGRKFRRAEEALMEAVEASRDIESARREFQGLRTQIEVEVPRQARYAYLKERLERVEIDLSNAYREHVTITNELASEQITSKLDERLRAVIEISILPERKRQERRGAVISVLLVLLFLTSLSPYSVSSLAYQYFNILGYSDQWTDAGLYSAFALGALVMAGVVLLLATLLPGKVGFQLSSVEYRRVTPLIGTALAAGLCVAGMIFRASAISADNSEFFIDPAPKETLAGFAFNFAALALAMTLASGALIVAGILRRRPQI